MKPINPMWRERFSKSLPTRDALSVHPWLQPVATNPLTIGFWLWLAYQLGAMALGEPVGAVTPSSNAVTAWLSEFGWPTVLGMGMFATGGAAMGYFGVKLIWRLRVWFKRRTRRPSIG